MQNSEYSNISTKYYVYKKCRKSTQLLLNHVTDNTFEWDEWIPLRSIIQWTWICCWIVLCVQWTIKNDKWSLFLIDSNDSHMLRCILIIEINNKVIIKHHVCFVLTNCRSHLIGGFIRFNKCVKIKDALSVVRRTFFEQIKILSRDRLFPFRLLSFCPTYYWARMTCK